MKKRDTIISIPELPKRSKDLSADQIQEMFGGCVEHMGQCGSDSECCSPPEGETVRCFSIRLGSPMKCYFVSVY
jgi:hypothetical protein